MTTKAYLEQAMYLDKTIDRKIREIESLRALAQKTSGVLSNMPRSTSPDMQPLETVTAKIVDLEMEVALDIDMLVDLKRELTDVINQVQNQEYQNLLALRYLCGESWDRIAQDMGYCLRRIYQIHEDAIKSIVVTERLLTISLNCTSIL